MKFQSYSNEAEFATESVRQAAPLAKKIQQEVRSAAFTKSDKSPVTVADFAVQALIAGMLQKQFPQDLLVGEEDASELEKTAGRPILEQVCYYLSNVGAVPASPAGRREPPLQSYPEICRWIDHGKADPAKRKRFWTLDPIDGTKGFVRGDQFAVALALIDEGEVKVGVLGCPNLSEASKLDPQGPGTLIAAVRGEGTWQQPLNEKTGVWKRLQVSRRKKSREAVLLRSYEKAHGAASQMNHLIAAMGIKKGPLQMDSLAKYAVLASGAADLLVRFPTERHPYESIWDQAAGQIVIEEAGGKVTDLDGKALDYTQGRELSANRGVLLSNGHLHNLMLQAVKKL